MNIFLCEMTFKYWDSELKIYLHETILHAFKSRDDTTTWKNDLNARQIEARQQALDFDPNGIPDNADAFEFMYAREMTTELT